MLTTAAAPAPAIAHSSPAAEVVFSARGLAKIYRSGELEVHALRDVDLEIRRGEFVVLLGASGSGKSTLLNILGGLDVPTRGEVRFADHELTGASESELTTYRREHVGFVFQFYNLIPSLTVRENLALVTDIANNPMPIDEAIDLVGLTPRRDHFPAQLAGGEQQRVAIARAIVKRPEVLVIVGLGLVLGMALGYGLVHLIAGLLKSDQFLFPVVIQASTYAWAGIAVLVSGVASALVVRRRIDKLDMVAALKTRE